MIFCELTLAIYKPPTGEEQVVEEELPYNEAYELIQVASPVSFVGPKNKTLVHFIFFIYFCKTSAMK